MLKHKNGRSIYSLGFLGLALATAGLSACNQSVEPNSRGEQAGGPAQSEQAAANPTVAEGQVLQGEELAAFLKMRGPQSQAETAPKMSLESKPAAKTAAYPACVVDFDSFKGLAHMDDRAYQFYATSPYYIQPCFPFYAFVTPSAGHNNYYLIPEEAGTCPGSYGQMGYGPDFSNCTNQRDAATFPRYAAKATSSDGNMAIVVSLPQDGINNPFTANSFYGISGTVKLYGKRSDGAWIHWPVQTFTSVRKVKLAGGANLSELDFYAGTSMDVFSIDNVTVTPN